MDSLDAGVRDQFLTIFNEVSDEYNARSTEINAQNKEKIIENKGVVRQLTPEQRDEWVKTMKPVWGKFQDDIGQDVIDAAVASNQAS